MRIWADDPMLSYSGRIDWNDKKAPVFVFPCTSVAVRFTGDRLFVHVKNKAVYWDHFLGCILDGEQYALPLHKAAEAGELLHAPENFSVLKNERIADGDGPACGGKGTQITLEIPVKNRGLSAHDLLLFKRQDACHELTFLGLTLAEGGRLLPPPAKPRRKIEVYGDSVSAGEVSEAVGYVGKADPVHNGEYSNSWYSYAWMTARKLGAQIHDIAQGGIALLDRTGYFCEPDARGMESVWDKVHYQPALGKDTEWDFSLYTPQIVIVAIGQNDAHPRNFMKEDGSGEMAFRWRWQYGVFLNHLREKYPRAYIVCCTTLLQHDAVWDLAIGEVVRGLEDDRITHYVFRRNGIGTPGHLRVPEAEEMAEELAAYLEPLFPEEEICRETKRI